MARLPVVTAHQPVAEAEGLARLVRAPALPVHVRPADHHAPLDHALEADRGAVRTALAALAVVLVHVAVTVVVQAVALLVRLLDLLHAELDPVAARRRAVDRVAGVGHRR